MNPRTFGWAALCASMLGAPWVSGQTPSFSLVGHASGADASRVHALSADGSVAAGYSYARDGHILPGFTWTRAGGRNDFGLEPGLPADTAAYGISGDGTTVVGGSVPVVGPLLAFRYRGPGAFETLGTVGTLPVSAALGTNQDGSVVVGKAADRSDSFSQAFRWTAGTGMQALGFTRPSGFYSEAAAVSRDGSTIVGYSSFGVGYSDAFVWTQAGGMQILPPPPGPPFSSQAHGMNFDGSIVVGFSGPAVTAAMWRNGQYTDLGVAPGFFHSFANGVSDDGSVVVGSMESSTSMIAGVWTPARGMEPLSVFLTRAGVAIPPGVTLTDCRAISGNGFTFGGCALTPTGEVGFVATVPAPSSLAPILVLALTTRRRGADAGWVRSILVV